MKFIFLLCLPNGDELNTIIEKNVFSEDVFCILFNYLAKDFQIHGLDCVLKSLRIADTDEILFQSTLSLSKHSWSCRPAAFFYNDSFLFKLSGPLFFPLVGWNSKVTIIENPPYWEVLNDRVRLNGSKLSISHAFLLNEILQRLGWFAENAIKLGPLLYGVRYSLNPESAFEFIDEWSLREQLAVRNFVHLFQIGLEESIREIHTCSRTEDLYSGFLVGPIRLKPLLDRFNIDLSYTHSQPHLEESFTSMKEKVWCIVRNSVVVETTATDPAGRYHDEITTIQVDAPISYFVKQGWRVQEQNVICENLGELKKDVFQRVYLNESSKFEHLPSVLKNLLCYLSFLQNEGIVFSKKLKLAVNQDEVIRLILR